MTLAVAARSPASESLNLPQLRGAMLSVANVGLVLGRGFALPNSQ